MKLSNKLHFKQFWVLGVSLPQNGISSQKQKIALLRASMVIIYSIKPFCSGVDRHKGTLKLQSCKLYNNKYMIASTQITKSEIFAFIAALVFKLLSRKVLYIRRKDNRNC